MILCIFSLCAGSQLLIDQHKALVGEIAISIGAVFGVFLGFHLFLRGFKLLNRKRLIQNIPTSNVRSACLGEVEIAGKAVGPYTIISPLSQSECFYYKATIGDAGDHVETLCVPFFVEDGTGHIMVDLRGAECQVSPSFEEQKYVYDLGECAQHFAARHGFTAGALVRVAEYCVQENDPLFILGTVAENPRHCGTAAFPITESGGGTDFLSADAAAAQRAVMLDMMTVPSTPAKIPTSATLENSRFDLHPPVILKKGEGKTPFVISSGSVKRLVHELASKSFLYIWGGPILVLLCVAVLLSFHRSWW